MNFLPINNKVNKKTRLKFTGHINRMKALALSLCFLSCTLPDSTVNVHAATLDERNEAMEARKSLPVQSNEIENWPKGPAIGAESAIVMEANTGIILYSKNIHEQLYPASTTKILTCLIAAETSSLDETVTFSENAVFSIPRGSSNMGMDMGQALTMEEALYGILVGSANETANAVAEHIGGSIEGFADMMNRKAQELGCVDSHFANPNGLHDDNHYTSAYDLAMIARSFFQNELLAKISNTPTRHFEPTETQPDDFILRTHHRLVTGEYSYDGIVGGKTGYTDMARQTLVTCAEQDGMKLICVVMKEESPNQFTDTMDLFNYGFSNFEVVNVAENETKYNIDNADFFQTENSIFGSSKPLLSLNRNSYLILPKTASFEDLESTISYDEENENQLATIDYSYNGVYVGSASIDMAANISSYDFDSPAEPVAAPEPAEKEEEKENIIFVNVKTVLLCILAGAGILILFFIVKSSIQNYSFAGRRRHKANYNRRTRLKYKQRQNIQPPGYGDYDQL